jgi:hypothetical protein
VVVKMDLFPRIPAQGLETFELYRHEWRGIHPGLETFKIKAI